MRPRRHDESGVIAVIVAVFSVVMFALAALVVDLGMAREVKRGAQTTADAAVLAGAGELYDDAGNLRAGEAIAAVKDVAAENFGIDAADWAGCSTTLPAGWSSSASGTSSGTSCIAFHTPAGDADGLPNEIQVVVPDTSTDVALGGIVGYDGSTVGAAARASAVSSATPPCGLCVLGPLRNGTAQVSLTGGGSIGAGSVDLTGGSGRLTVTDGGTIAVTGTANPASGSKYSPNPPSISTGIAVKDYHLGKAAMPPLPPDRLDDSVACARGSSPTTLPPGRYHDIEIGNGTCTFQNGLFVITGKVHLSSAKSRLTGSAVTLYFACGSRSSPNECGGGQAGGWLDTGQSGEVALTATAYNGLSVVYAPANTAGLFLGARGSDDDDDDDDDDRDDDDEAGAPVAVLAGGLYARSARLSMTNGAAVVNGRVVVGSLEVSGDSTAFRVNAPGLAQVPGPPEILLTK
jgi:Flp pilus assembly protein TadG